MTVSELIEKVIEETGYNKMLMELTDLTERDERQNNLGELVSAAKQYEENAETPSLVEFLEDVALVSDVDKYDETADAVVFMTIHSSKGLEFPTVFLPGMEENIFPGFQTIISTDPREIEEERRLAYVAITRAKKKLYITHVKDRMINGRSSCNQLSRFAAEIPEHLAVREDTGDGAVNIARTRPQKVKPVNQFLKETAKPVPTMAKRPEAPSSKFEAGDRVRHISFGVGTVLSVKPMGADTLYEIAFDTVGTKKLMATYAKLTKG